MTKDNQKHFRQRLVNGDLLVGIWVKTPSPIICEVLGKTDLDALCLDAEHAPFGRLELDTCISATRAAGSTPLVRVPSADASNILNALDCGATGIVVPHVKSREDAETACRRSQYGPGGRGFSGSTRAAEFGGTTVPEHLSQSASQTTVIAQIEDVEGLESIRDIAAVERLDCLFIGIFDLAVSMGQTDPKHPNVVDAIDSICSAGRNAGKAIGMYFSDAKEAKQWIKKGVSLFLLSSDQAFLSAGARNLISDIS